MTVRKLAKLWRANWSREFFHLDEEPAADPPPPPSSDLKVSGTLTVEGTLPAASAPAEDTQATS